jgi:DNA-binding transcriptional MocR family regulator
VFLIEDDAARDLDLAGDAFSPLINGDVNGHVIYVRSLTKGVAPALRVAAVVARGPAQSRLRHALGAQNSFVSTLLQLIACEVLSAPAWPRHVERLRRELIERRDTMIRGVTEGVTNWSVTSIPPCGLHLWVRLADDADEADLVGRIERSGVRVSAGHPFYPAEPVAPHLRLTYAAATSATIVEAMTRVAAALR